jgi:hypothetical protein
LINRNLKKANPEVAFHGRVEKKGAFYLSSVPKAFSIEVGHPQGRQEFLPYVLSGHVWIGALRRRQIRAEP